MFVLPAAPAEILAIPGATVGIMRFVIRDSVPLSCDEKKEHRKRRASRKILDNSVTELSLCSAVSWHTQSLTRCVVPTIY